MKVSIVIPTHNRPEQLSTVLDHVFSSLISGVCEFDVIVVDDGSSLPVAEIVSGKMPPEGFRLQCITQENAGPAAARNNGFAHARGDIVLFIDDDILVTQTTIGAHLRAHETLENCAVFGPCPYAIPEIETSAYRFLRNLDTSYGEQNEEELTKVDIISSGNLSIKRVLFEDGVYRPDLKTPAAEEFELEFRLNSNGTPIYVCNSARAWHLQPPTIESKCIQEYKYGIGAAEILAKSPEIVNNEHLFRIVHANGPISLRDDDINKISKKIVKGFLANRIVRNGLLRFCKITEQVLPIDRMLFPMYRLLIGLHLFAGVRIGMNRFAQNSGKHG